MKINNVKLLTLVILFSLMNIVFMQFLITNQLFYQTYEHQLTNEVITRMLSFKNKYAWLNYLLTPLLLLLKIGFISICFWVGSFINNPKSKHKDYLRVVLFSEIVCIIFSFIRTAGLYYYKFQTLTEINQFQPFSLYSVLNVNNIPEYLHYPLALISLPQTIYWVVLSLLLKPMISGNFLNRLGFVAKTYGVGLLIWISIVVFLTLTFSS